jgi:hypothetical protein
MEVGQGPNWGCSAIEKKLDGGEWSASRSGEGVPGTHWIEGCEDPRACLDAVE